MRNFYFLSNLCKTITRSCSVVAILLTIGVGNVWGTEAAYKTAKFGKAASSGYSSNYTSTWTSVYSGFSVSVSNGNTNGNGASGWAYVKFGRKDYTSVGVIQTSSAIDLKVKSISITIDAVTSSKINSIKVYSSSNGSTWSSSLGSFTVGTGTKTVTLSSPTANLYYKIEFDCASGSSNGLISVSQVDFNVETFTVSYDANGGSGTMTDASSPYFNGKSVTVKSNSFTYTGHTFTGWNTAPGGGGTGYAASASFSISANTTLYAQWETACANSVTISKGTGTNCTFTLSKSGAQASCDGVSTTVTVSPTSGYGSPSVTESGASAAPTITGSSNTYTVAYAANTTGTSTINVSCSANNYTINLNTDLTPTSAGTTSITATYNANTNLTSAITKPTKTGWTFGGYFTGKNGTGTQIIDASGNVIASVSGYTDASKNWKYAGNITLYAKWTCTVTWSVNGSTSVYPAQTVTYNASGSKVASIPGPPSPASYCGDKFMGWSAKSAGSESKTTSYYDDLFTTVGGSPDIKSIGDITFYAVFADYDED